MSSDIRYRIELEGAEKASKDVRTFAQAVRDADKATSSLGNKKGISASDLLKAIGGNFSQATLARNAELFKQLGDKAGQAFGTGMKNAIQTKVPPIIVPAWKNVLAGALSIASGNQYLAARSFMGAAGVGGAGGGGIGLGGLGGAGGNFLPAAFALAGVKVAAELLRKAFEETVDAFKRGSKLFIDSAKIGESQLKLASSRNALSLIGVSEEEADRMLLQGQFGVRRSQGTVGTRGTTSRSGGAIASGGDIFGGRGAGQLGDLQQVTNLEKELAMARKDTAAASLAEAMSSRTLFETMYNFKVVIIDIRGVFSDFAALIAGPLKAAFSAVDIVLKVMLAQLNDLVFLGQVLHLIPKGQDFTKTGGSGQRIPVSNFERLGFHFGGNLKTSAGDPMHQTAQNTGKMVGLLTSINAALQGGGGTRFAASSPHLKLSPGGLDPYAHYTREQLHSLFNNNIP